MEYKENDSTLIQEGVWDEKTCIRMAGGFTLSKDNLPSDLVFLPKGAVMAYDEDNEAAVVVKTAKVYMDVESDSTTLFVCKGHILVTGDVIDGYTISEIDTSNDDYDIIVLTGSISSGYDKGYVIADENAGNAIGLNYATVRVDSYPSCTITSQAYEIEEDSLPYPVNDTIKTALTVRHAWKI